MLAAHLDDHWLILDNRRAELIEDSDASTFTPMFAIDDHGVQLFAAPYAGPVLTGGDAGTAPSTNASGE